MAISARSASESLAMFGLKNDGPLNQGGLGAKPVSIPGVTTADKLVKTPKPVKASRKAGKPIAESIAEPDTTIAESADARYKKANAEKIRERDRLRKAAKKAKT